MAEDEIRCTHCNSPLEWVQNCLYQCVNEKCRQYGLTTDVDPTEESTIDKIRRKR